MTWPKLPKTVRCSGGPVKVKLANALKSEGAECWGLWDPTHRVIRIVRSLPMEQRWRVFYHELVHAVLCDSGLENVFPEQGVETLCDAMSSARMMEMRGQLGMEDG